MKLFLVSLVLASLLITACTSHEHQQPAGNASEVVQTPEDSMYKAVIQLHDEAMPKMGKLIGLQKSAQQQIDSLKAAGKTANTAIISKLEQLKQLLASAEKGMNDWMVQFEPDPQMPTTEERQLYFTKQHTMALKMRNDIFAALDSATAILK